MDELGGIIWGEISRVFVVVSSSSLGLVIFDDTEEDIILFIDLCDEYT